MRNPEVSGSNPLSAICFNIKQRYNSTGGYRESVGYVSSCLLGTFAGIITAIATHDLGDSLIPFFGIPLLSGGISMLAAEDFFYFRPMHKLKKFYAKNIRQIHLEGL